MLGEARMDHLGTTHLDIYDEVAYVYDGSLEGLLSSIFAAYANHEHPSEVVSEGFYQPRLAQRTAFIETDMEHASRVRKGLVKRDGTEAFSMVRRASCSSDYNAGTAVYNFVRYVMDEHKGKLRASSNIAHPKVAPIHALCRSVNSECEHMRQFIRFRHVKDESADFWYARCNPRDSVVPLVMDHFVERFSVQPFMIYDEVHGICGVYDGGRWFLVNATGMSEADFNIPEPSSEEKLMDTAWKLFYRTVAIDARYNPELRRHFMPKRLWRNLNEIQDLEPGIMAL